MIKHFLRDRKSIVATVVTVILCAGIFTVAEIFLFKRKFIAFSAILAAGIAITLAHLYFKRYQAAFLQNILEKSEAGTDIASLKKFKFYDISKMHGAFTIITDSFDVSGKALKCRLMHCLEGIPIFFIAIQVIIAVSLKKSMSYVWGLEVLFFFIMLNINIYLAFLYKNSAKVGTQIDNYMNDFENHVLLHKSMFFAYVLIEIIAAVLGFICIFIPALNVYWWAVYLVFIPAVGVLLGALIGINKRNRSKNSRGA